jgi:hypothetical protein
MEKRTLTGAANEEKKSYNSPRFTVYGDLHRLTMGAGGTRADRTGSTKR